MIRTYSTSTLSSRKVREGGSERWGVSKHSVEDGKLSAEYSETSHRSEPPPVRYVMKAWIIFMHGIITLIFRSESVRTHTHTSEVRRLSHM